MLNLLQAFIIKFKFHSKRSLTLNMCFVSQFKFSLFG